MKGNYAEISQDNDNPITVICSKKLDTKRRTVKMNINSQNVVFENSHGIHTT